MINPYRISARGTDNTSAKRVRIDDQEADSNTIESPTTAAKTAFATGAHALPLAIQDSVNSEGVNYITLLTKLRSKEKSLLKYNDDSYIPQSVQVKIKMIGSTRINQSERFKGVQNDTDMLTITYQQAVRKNTKKVLGFELEALREDLSRIVTKITRVISRALLLQDKECRDPVVLYCLATTALNNTQVKSALFGQDIKDFLKEHFPIPQDAPCEDTIAKYKSDLSSMSTKVRRHIVDILVTTIEKYDKRIKSKLLAKEMAEMAITETMDSAAVEMMEVVDIAATNMNIEKDPELYAQFQLFLKEKQEEEETAQDKPVKDRRGASKRNGKPNASASLKKKSAKKNQKRSGDAKGNDTKQNKKEKEGKKHQKKSKSGKKK